MADLQTEMKHVKTEVDKLILEEILPKSNKVGEVNLLYKMMRDYPSRTAKGMRPFLCVTTSKAAGGTERDSLLTAACAEMFHHWILIHDDIEDRSELRRGEPSLHVKYTEALALNAGDALHARMWGALAKNQGLLGADVTLKIINEFSDMVNQTTEGQHMELGWVHYKRWDLKESDYYQMCSKKTSWYTIAGPCRLGAIVAGAPVDTLDKLLQFGIKLGIAFQIQDDALNLVGDQTKYGKAKSDDILEGKRTLILLHVLGRASSPERKRLLSIMNKGRDRKTASEVSYVLSLVEEYDAVGYARRRAVGLMKEAIAILKDIKWTGDRGAVSLLEQFAKFAVDREW